MQLAIRETGTRDAVKLGKQTVAYLAINRELHGHRMVARSNLHEELVEALREAEGELRTLPESIAPLVQLTLQTVRTAISKAETIL